MERTLVSDSGAFGSPGTQTRVSCGTATVVDAFAPYEPTIRWSAPQEPTVAWTYQTPRPAPHPWLIGLGSAGLAAALVAGFYLGRTVPVSAADRAASAKPAETVRGVGPAPFVPSVLPEAPDLSRSYPVPAASPIYPSAPATPQVPAGRRWAASAPAPRVSIRPVTRAHTRPAPVRMSAAAPTLPPAVQLYGTQRRASAPVVATWYLPSHNGRPDG